MPLPDDFQISGFADIDALDFSIAEDIDPTPDPLSGCVPTASMEHDAKEEMSALKAGFIARVKAEEARRRAATDSEYWCCICFQSREQVEAFLTVTGWASADGKYLDGQKVAAKMGIALPSPPKIAKIRAIDKHFANLAMEE